MKQLFSYLKPLKNRICLKMLISTVSIALTIAVGIDAVLVLYSKFVYMYGVKDIAIIIPVVIIAVALIIWQFMLPSDYRVAGIADSLGFKERFITAFEILNKKEKGLELSGTEKLAVEDALSRAKKADFKSLYSLKPEKYTIIAPFIAIAFFSVVYFLPIEPSEAMEQQQELHQLLDNTVEEMNDRVDGSNLTAKQKKEVKKELKELKKELSKADNKKEAVNSLMQGQAKLKKKTDESENANLQSIGNKLSQNKATQSIGEMLKSGNIEDFNEAIENINKNLDKMTEAEIKELGKAFKDAAQSSDIDDNTRELLEQLGDTMQSELTDEQLAEISSNLSEFSDKINELAKQNKDMRDAIEKLNNDLARAGDRLNGNTNTNTNTNTNSNANVPGQQMPVQNSNSGKNSNSVSERGNGGTGAGKGTIPNANVYTSNAKHMGEYDAQLDDNSNGQKTGESVNTKTQGENGQVVPYTEVFNQYKDEAMNNIERDEIPYGVKDIVRDYFSSLE